MSYSLKRDPISPTVRTLYLNFDEYKIKPTYHNLDKMYEEKINGVIKLLGMTPQKWIYEYKKDGNGKMRSVKLGRFAVYDNFPFRFYIKRTAFKSNQYIADIFLENPKTKVVTKIYSIENIYYNVHSGATRPSTDFLNYNATAMVEVIKDEGGGMHFWRIDKNYNNASFGDDGWREDGVHIVNIYDISDDSKVYYGINYSRNGNFYLYNEINNYLTLPVSNERWSNEESAEFIFFNYTNRYNPLSSNEGYFTNVALLNRQYMIGSGCRMGRCDESVSGNEIDTAEHGYYQCLWYYANSRMKLVSQKTGKVVYMIKSYVFVITYLPEDQNISLGGW
jgi:hypothetical protein